MARKTNADLPQQWFKRDVAGIFKQHHTFDPEGIFIGDGSYALLTTQPTKVLRDCSLISTTTQSPVRTSPAAYRWRRQLQAPELHPH
jgi:hypothetical protein